MTIIRSIWNGPFYVGKLVQPVSVGDVFLKILEVLWRALVVIVGIVAGGAATIAAYYFVVSPLLFPPVKDKVVGTAFYAANLPEPPPVVSVTPAGGEPALPTKEEIQKQPCPKLFPIRITIQNDNDEAVTDVSFDLKGYASGFSANYVRDWGYRSSDRIMPPGGGWSQCYAVSVASPMKPEDLTYKVELWSASEID